MHHVICKPHHLYEPHYRNRSSIYREVLIYWSFFQSSLDQCQPNFSIYLSFQSRRDTLYVTVSKDLANRLSLLFHVLVQQCTNTNDLRQKAKGTFFFCVCNIKADMWKYVDTFIVLFEIPLEIMYISKRRLRTEQKSGG